MKKMILIGPSGVGKILDSMTAEVAWIFCGNYFSTLGIEFWKKVDTAIWSNIVSSRIVS